MSTYNRLQIDDNNLQNKYLKYKYKYLKQKQIIQSGSLNLEGGSTLAIAATGICVGIACYLYNNRNNSITVNISVLLNSTQPTRYIYKYIYNKLYPLPENSSKITFSKFVEKNNTYSIDEYFRQGNWTDIPNYSIDELISMFDENNKIHITDIRFFDHWSKTGKKNQIAEQTLLAEKNIYNDEEKLNKLLDYEKTHLDKYNFLASIIHSNLLDKQSHYIWATFGSYCEYETISFPKLWDAKRQEGTIKLKTDDIITITNIYIPNKIENKNELARKISTNSTSSAEPISEIKLSNNSNNSNKERSKSPSNTSKKK